MEKPIIEFLASLKVPCDAISAIKVEPGATYLLVIDSRMIDMATWHSLTEGGLGKFLGIKAAVIGAFGDPNEAIAAFKIKDGEEATDGVIIHGVNCRKAAHKIQGGYLHGEDDDTPYMVDGCKYCGRCHTSI